MVRGCGFGRRGGAGRDGEVRVRMGLGWDGVGGG